MKENQNFDISMCFIKPDSLVSDAILSLEHTSKQICLVVSDTNQLVGIITDGDIRRGLLEGHTVKSSVNKIMKTKPIVVSEDTTKEDAFKLMKVNLIRHMPVVNDKNQIVNIHMIDNIMAVEKKNNFMVIMAGGFGKRLAPYTDDRPKPMLLVDGKPMLEHIINKAIADGFSNFIISVFYLSEVIKDYFGDGSSWGINIQYIKEKNPLGTAGALSIIDPVPELPIIVTNGDVISKIRYADILDFHMKKKGHATMAIRSHEWQNPFGVVNTQGINIESFDEKPVYKSNINAGIYVLDSKVLDLLKKDEVCDMPNLFKRAKSMGFSTIAFPMHEYWVDVGRPEDLSKLNTNK